MRALAAALVLAGSGAAVGAVLTGKIQGTAPVAVSRALLVGTPVDQVMNTSGQTVPQNVKDGCGGMVVKAQRFVGTARDDHTGFQAAAEISAGECVAIGLPLKNGGGGSLAGQVSLDVPSGLAAELTSLSSAVNIGSVVRTGRGSWAFSLSKGAAYDEVRDSLTLILAAADNIVPGSYTVTGRVKQIGYSEGETGKVDLTLDGDGVGLTMLSAGNVAPGSSGTASTTLSNVGSHIGELDVVFSSILNTSSPGGPFYDGIGDLGGVAEMAIFLDMDGDGSWNGGDTGLKSDGTVYTFPQPLDYVILNDYGGRAFPNVMGMASGESGKFVISWRVPASAGNNIQGDTAYFDVVFILHQPD